jgi:hypothetical protein
VVAEVEVTTIVSPAQAATSAMPSTRQIRRDDLTDPSQQNSVS